MRRHTAVFVTALICMDTVHATSQAEVVEELGAVHALRVDVIYHGYCTRVTTAY